MMDKYLARGANECQYSETESEMKAKQKALAFRKRLEIFHGICQNVKIYRFEHKKQSTDRDAVR